MHPDFLNPRIIVGNMNKKAVSYIFAFAAVIFWGTSFIATKIAYEAIPPLTLCLIRFAISAIVLGVIKWLRHDQTKLQKKDVNYFLVLALIGISVYYSCENIAVSMTNASTASLISGSYPAITVLVGTVFYRLRMSRKKWLGVILAVAGVVILTDFTSDESGNYALIGDIIMIFDGFLWAFYNFLIPRADRSYSTFDLTYYQTLFGVLFLIPGAVYEHPALQVWSSKTWIAVGYLSLGCSVAAYLLYNAALRNIAPDAAAVIMNLMPVAGVVCSALILGEAITLKQIAGGAIIITGVILSVGVKKDDIT